MNITLSTVDNGARNHNKPYIHAHVEGTRVRFIERVDEDFIGWRCDEHGDVDCIHALVVEGLLSRKIRDRIKYLGIVQSERDQRKQDDVWDVLADGIEVRRA